MPIPDSLLDKPQNAHLRRPAHETVYEALRAWRFTPHAADWWWLVIDHGGGAFRAAQFETLERMLRRPELNVTMRTRLADLPSAQDEHGVPGVLDPQTVEQNALTSAAARQAKASSPGHVLIVLRSGAFRGILASAERTFAFTDHPLMDMLDQYEQQTAASSGSDSPSSPPEPPG